MNISKYKKQGFRGIDVDLLTSISEYHLIWKEYKYNLKKRQVVKGEILAIYNLGLDEIATDCGYFTKKDLLELDWIEWKEVASCQGMAIKELKNQDTGNLLFSLLGYYNYLNFF